MGMLLVKELLGGEKGGDKFDVMEVLRGGERLKAKIPGKKKSNGGGGGGKGEMLGGFNGLGR